MQGILTKTHQIQRIRTSGCGGGPRPTWWGRLTPMASPDAPPSPATSTILPHGKKTHFGDVSTVDPMSFWSRASVEVHMDPWAHCHTQESCNTLKFA